MLDIIIPTIGRDTLQRAIDSVINQTIPTHHIVVEDPKRKGAAWARNTGIRESTSSWVGFCDDDDELDEHYHEWLVAYTNYDLVIFKMKNQPNGAIPYTESIEELVFNQVGISFAVRREVAEKFPFHNMVGEDYNLIIRIKTKGYKIKIVDKIAYYIHGKNGTN